MPEASTFLFHIFGIGVTLTDIASVATAISVFIGILQLSASRRVRVENAKRSAVKEAVEIAKLFQRDLIVNMSFVTSICDKTGLSSYTKEKIPDDKPLEFTREEATSYCGCDSQQKLEEFEKKTTPEILNQAAFLIRNIRFLLIKRTEKPKTMISMKLSISETRYLNTHLQWEIPSINWNGLLC